MYYLVCDTAPVVASYFLISPTDEKIAVVSNAVDGMFAGCRKKIISVSRADIIPQSDNTELIYLVELFMLPAALRVLTAPISSSRISSAHRCGPTVNIEILTLSNYRVFLKLAVFLILAPVFFSDFFPACK